MAGIGPVLSFIGAVIAVTRAKAYAHLPFPLTCLAPVVVPPALA